MYLSSDSSSILVSCHRSPLSIIHYYPLSIIHYCNIATLHCNIPLSSIHYCGSLNHPRQKFSNPFVFECFSLFLSGHHQLLSICLFWESTSPKNICFWFSPVIIFEHFSWSINVWLVSGYISLYLELFGLSIYLCSIIGLSYFLQL